MFCEHQKSPALCQWVVPFNPSEWIMKQAGCTIQSFGVCLISLFACIGMSWLICHTQYGWTAHDCQENLLLGHHYPTSVLTDYLSQVISAPSIAFQLQLEGPSSEIHAQALCNPYLSKLQQRPESLGDIFKSGCPKLVTNSNRAQFSKALKEEFERHKVAF